MTRTIRAAIRFMGGTGLVAFFMAAFTPLPNTLYRRLCFDADGIPGSRWKTADAIVVLGATVSPDGILDASSLRRALSGILLKRQGLSAELVLLGAPNGRSVEAVVRARLAQALGISAASIVADSQALTTQQEAERAAALLVPRGARHILLVTGALHMPRAIRVFQRAGFEVVPAPVLEISAETTKPAERLAMSRLLVITLAAHGYYGVLGRL